jgi:hypothetical protein
MKCPASEDHFTAVGTAMGTATPAPRRLRGPKSNVLALRRDRLKCVLGDAQVPERIISPGVRLLGYAQAIAPPRHPRRGHHNLGPTLPAAPMERTERDRVLAEIEVCLDLDSESASKSLLEFYYPPSCPIVTVIDRTAHSRKHRMNLDAWIAERDQRICVARAHRLIDAACTFDVLPRHRLRSISPA